MLAFLQKNPKKCMASLQTRELRITDKKPRLSVEGQIDCIAPSATFERGLRLFALSGIFLSCGSPAAVLPNLSKIPTFIVRIFRQLGVLLSAARIYWFARPGRRVTALRSLFIELFGVYHTAPANSRNFFVEFVQLSNFLPAVRSTVS